MALHLLPWRDQELKSISTGLKSGLVIQLAVCWYSIMGLDLKGHCILSSSLFEQDRWHVNKPSTTHWTRRDHVCGACGALEVGQPAQKQKYLQLHTEAWESPLEKQKNPTEPSPNQQLTLVNWASGCYFKPQSVRVSCYIAIMGRYGDTPKWKDWIHLSSRNIGLCVCVF